MEKIVFRKQDGITTKRNRQVNLSESPYLIEDENFLKDYILNEKVKKVSSNDIRLLKNQVSNVIKEISVRNRDFITKVYEMIKYISSKEDLKKICEIFIDTYEEMLNIKYNLVIEKTKEIKENMEIAREEIEENFDIFASIVIKSIVRKYYLNKLSFYDAEKINELEMLKIDRYPVDRLFMEIGESFDDSKIQPGTRKFAARVFLDTIDTFYDRGQKHLCWLNCKNATANKCRKIADSKKKNIDEYDFIIDGYQVINEKNLMENFIVTNCLNYEEEFPKKLTVEDMKRINAARAYIRMEYFDSGSLKEAKSTQKIMHETGQLVYRNNTK